MRWLAMLEQPQPSSTPLVGIGFFSTLATAREAALVLGARGLVYEIDNAGRGWVVLVEERMAACGLQELERWASERASAPPPVAEAVLPPLQPGQLVLPGVLFVAMYQAQSLHPEWVRRGVADSLAILDGALWRTVTALTLHADGAHLLANLTAGLLFAAFLEPRLGSGVLWLLVLVSGALGNFINAWCHRGGDHLSLGSSTAVFGALGLLIGLEFWARWHSRERCHRWQLVLPLGAGLSLFAFMGTGEATSHVDVAAHLWGFLSGIVLGSCYEFLAHGRRAGLLFQAIASVLTVLFVAGCWALALND